MKNLNQKTTNNEFASVELKDLFTQEVTENQLSKADIYSEKEFSIKNENNEIVGAVEILVALDIDNSVIEVYRKQILNEVPYIHLYTIDIDDITKRLSEKGTYSIVMNDYVGYQIISALKSVGMEFKSKTYNDVETLSSWGNTDKAVYSLSIRETHNPEKVRINIFKYEERQKPSEENEVKNEIAKMVMDI